MKKIVSSKTEPDARLWKMVKTLFHEIKRQAPDLPVIIFTAYDSYREDPRLTQADGYVIKSMILDELKAKIADVIQVKHAMEVTTEPGLRSGNTFAVGAY